MVIYDDNAPDVQGFLRREGGSWPAVPDPGGRVALDYGVSGIPETFLIDPRGVIVGKITGGLHGTRARRAGGQGERPRPVTLRRLVLTLPWLAVGVVVAVALVIGSQRPSKPGPLDARVLSIAGGIRCPTCQGETAADSQVYAAQAIRADIARRLEARDSPSAIRAYLVSRYGSGILESPPTHGLSVLVWVLPPVAVSAAAVGLVVALRHSRPRRVSSLAEEDRSLVAVALEDRSPLRVPRFDGPSVSRDSDAGEGLAAGGVLLGGEEHGPPG